MQNKFCSTCRTEKRAAFILMVVDIHLLIFINCYDFLNINELAYNKTVKLVVVFVILLKYMFQTALWSHV